MPWSAPNRCLRCGRAGCTEHVLEDWKTSKPIHRMRGRGLQRERDRLFREHHYTCAVCGRVKLPMDLVRDHTIPLAEGGQDVRENTRPVCLDCHKPKSDEEARRGRARNKP